MPILNLKMRIEGVLALANIETKSIWELETWELHYINTLYDYMEINEYKKYIGKLKSYAYRAAKYHPEESPIEILNKFIEKYPDSKKWLIKEPDKTLKIIYWKGIQYKRKQGLS